MGPMGPAQAHDRAGESVAQAGLAGRRNVQKFEGARHAVTPRPHFGLSDDWTLR